MDGDIGRWWSFFQMYPKTVFVKEIFMYLNIKLILIDIMLEILLVIKRSHLISYKRNSPNDVHKSYSEKVLTCKHNPIS